MAVDALLAALERDAEAEAARIRAGSRERAGDLLARAAAQADRQRAARLERLLEERRRAVSRETAEAERGLRRRLLLARAEVLDGVFAAARQELLHLPAVRYAAVLPQLVDEALHYLEGRETRLSCPPDAAGTVAQWVAGRPGVTVEGDGDAPAGVGARTADGGVVVDNTLAARLERMRADLAVALVERLSGRADEMG